MVIVSVNLTPGTIARLDVLSGVIDGGNRSAFLERIVNDVFQDPKIQEDIEKIEVLKKEILGRYVKGVSRA